jgi:hypothetical protein
MYLNFMDDGFIITYFIKGFGISHGELEIKLGHSW